MTAPDTGAVSEDTSFGAVANEIPPVWGERYRAGLGRHGDDPENNCALCGRRIRRAGGGRGAGLFLRMDAGLGAPIRLDDPAEQDGGYFPIGTNCAGEFPDGYVTELAAGSPASGVAE